MCVQGSTAVHFVDGADRNKLCVSREVLVGAPSDGIGVQRIWRIVGALVVRPTDHVFDDSGARANEQHSVTRSVARDEGKDHVGTFSRNHRDKDRAVPGVQESHLGDELHVVGRVGELYGAEISQHIHGNVQVSIEVCNVIITWVFSSLGVVPDKVVHWSTKLL
jgi:hypothetical protein